MVASALHGWAGDDAQRIVEGAVILAGLSGLFLLAMAALRLGWLTHFISHPVLSGFVTGAAIFIVGTQLRGLFGIEAGDGVHFIERMAHIITHWSTGNVLTCVFGLSQSRSADGCAQSADQDADALGGIARGRADYVAAGAISDCRARNAAIRAHRRARAGGWRRSVRLRGSCPGLQPQRLGRGRLVASGPIGSADRLWSAMWKAYRWHARWPCGGARPWMRTAN